MVSSRPIRVFQPTDLLSDRLIMHMDERNVRVLLPILRNKHYGVPSAFTPESLLREARRQKGIPNAPVPEICILDPDDDIVRHLRAALCGLPSALPDLRSGLSEEWRLHHARYFMNDVHHHVGSDCEQNRERTNDREGDASRGEARASTAMRNDMIFSYWGATTVLLREMEQVLPVLIGRRAFQ
jgi:hypothetical protein